MAFCARYVASPDATHDDPHHDVDALLLQRRGVSLGWITRGDEMTWPSRIEARARWQPSKPIVLPGCATSLLDRHTSSLSESEQLVNAILNGHECSEYFGSMPYSTRLAPRFDLLADSFDEGDDQEIVTLEFDAYDQGQLVADNLWAKVSWLSFCDDDPSLRFRFSFGIANYDEVAKNLSRQLLAAELCEAVFPESALITKSQPLNAFLCDLVDCETLAFVERIVYFNAPNGGAQFHQDVERGHLGVVYAQATGHSFWLALSKQDLIKEIINFHIEQPRHRKGIGEQASHGANDKLHDLVSDPSKLGLSLDEDIDELEILLNQSPQFARQLIEHGHGYILDPGDVLLLPQQDLTHCAWHSVFCVGNIQGEGLSFAFRRTPD